MSIKDALSVQELKAICAHFFNAGYDFRNQADDFETVFNTLMAGKYNKMIEDESFKIKWQEMQAAINKEMEKFDKEQRIKAAMAVKDLENFIIVR